MAEKEQSDTWVVGAEHDAALFHRLGSALESLGYQFEKSSWGVAGSQEVTTWHAKSQAGVLSVESETYIGLRVSGPKGLLAALKSRFAAVADKPET